MKNARWDKLFRAYPPFIGMKINNFSPAAYSALKNEMDLAF